MKSPIRILIVEDEMLTALALEMELKHAGYVVCNNVVSGEEAVASAARDHPDVILMDIRLVGELDGIEAAQRIQAAAPIPIIFMTAYKDETLTERVQQLKPLGYLSKPVSPHVLKPIFEAAFP